MSSKIKANLEDRENKVLDCNCMRVIIAFILKLVIDDENKTLLPSHDWSLLGICGVLVHKSFISLQC